MNKKKLKNWSLPLLFGFLTYIHLWLAAFLFTKKLDTLGYAAGWSAIFFIVSLVVTTMTAHYRENP